MGLLSWLIVGAIAGWAASMIMSVNAQMGLLSNIFAGIIGALVGGFIMGTIGGTGITGLNIPSIAVATGGAVVVIAVARMLHGSRTTA